MSKSVLLLGGSGLLGTAVGDCLKNGDRFSVFAPSHAEFDILNSEHTVGISKFDIVCNFTGQVSSSMADCQQCNTVGMQNIVDAITGTDTLLVQISTVSVYGEAKNITEQSPLQPQTKYGEYKLVAESIVQSSLPVEQYTIARLCNLYGSGQNKGLLWYILDCIQQKKDITITDNDGSLQRHFLHKADAATIITSLLVNNVHGVINITGPEMYSIKDIISLCEKILGRPIPVSYADAAPIGNINSFDDILLQKSVSPQYNHTLEQYLSAELL